MIHGPTTSKAGNRDGNRTEAEGLLRTGHPWTPRAGAPLFIALLGGERAHGYELKQSLEQEFGDLCRP